MAVETDSDAFAPTDTAMSDSRRRHSNLLTVREVEVLALVAMGLTDRQIALRLGISEATVHHHLSNTYFKLSAVNRAQAVVVAIKLGHTLDG